MKAKKDHFVITRVTEEEKEKVIKETEKNGFEKISDYIRSKLGL